MKSNRVLISIVFLFGSFIVTAIYYNLSSDLKNVVNFFTLFGTYLSLFGIIISYIQIRSVRQTSFDTQNAVNNSLFRINQILSVSELSRATKIIQEVQSFIISTKYELALLRMKDLKGILIQVKYNNDLAEYTGTELYNQQITDLGIDINNLNDFITGNKKGVKFRVIDEHLESISTTLAEFENNLKYK